MGDVAARSLFVLTVAWGALVFWLAPYPPMTDLPQHAGQVSLLKDLLLGQSPWNELFRINAFTPYIIGYGLALPLSFLLPVATALKLLLSLAYVAFVALCVTLRRHFGADRRLDWLFLISFFGFSYKWGFFTFLLAASVGLWFILVADRYAHERTSGRAAVVVAVGLLLLVSHGLVFLFGLAVGMGLLLVHIRRPKALLAAMLPYGALLLGFGVYFVINRQVNAGMETELASITHWAYGLSRIPRAIVYSVASDGRGGAIFALAPAVVGMLCIPWLLGLRIDWRHRSSWVPFATVVGIFVFVPSFALSTAYLYERFALFLLPAYAWMFTSARTAAGKTETASSAMRPEGWPWQLSLMLLSWLVLAITAFNAWRFGKESADFPPILNALEPGQRALALILDPHSAADRRVYGHYPLWYQAEKQGLADSNFAWSPAMIVRFRQDRLPAIRPGFEWRPERFDWVANRGDDYKYFIVRHSGTVPEALFKGAACPPQRLAVSGHWTVYVRASCPQLAVSR